MSEEELVILQNIQYALDNVGSVDFGDFEFDDIQGLLDLYQKEKEKNKNKENILSNIQEEFNKYDWKNANPIQTYNQVKSLYQSIFLKEMEK